MSPGIEPMLRAKRSGYWSPNLPRRDREFKRRPTPDATTADIDAEAPPASSSAAPAEASDAESETLFETTLLAMAEDKQGLSKLEIARRLHRDWTPPEGSFQLTDKTI